MYTLSHAMYCLHYFPAAIFTMEVHKHGVSILGSINLGETIFTNNLKFGKTQT